MLNHNIKIDLHIHSKASEYKENIGYLDNSTIKNIDVLLSKLQENNVNLISITDHNHFDYYLYKKIRSLINKDPYSNVKNTLPGVEFDVKLESDSKIACHIICIFDDADDEKVEKIQNAIQEVRELTKRDDYYSLKEFEDILYKINLSVLLIAHQKSGFEAKFSSQNHHSLSEAVDDPEEWIRTGFINALEYQKPRVQGMLKSSLKTIKAKFATITGSDCHVWSAYPNKDNNVIQKKKYLTTIKCLPTFKGLVLALTSPETRFDRRNEGSNSSFINEIKLGDNTYELSTGINAIIGENGSGKTYILGKLNGEDEPKYKKIDSINKIKVSKIGSPSITKISQGEIIDKVKTGKLLENDPEYYDEIPTINEFKININNFITNLKKYIDERIRIKENQDKIYNLKIQIKEFNNEKNYYISLNNDVETINNEAKDRFTAIDNIYAKLYNEYKSNFNFYINKKEELIKNILNTLQELRNIISIDKENFDLHNKITNIVIGVFNDMSEKIKKDRTSQENENEEMNSEIRDFSMKIKNYLTGKKSEGLYPIFPKELDGTSIKSKYGFKFIKEAKYNNENLEEAFYKYIFTQNYQTSDKIKKINTKEEFAKAVAGIKNYELIEGKLESNVQRFISEYIKEETSIKDENGTDEIGTTPGEIALTFYKLKLSREISSDVILIDQPEDDISMKRIENYLINYFNNIRDKKQVIFVTHNPLLVVNLDVDNVINISKDRSNNIKIMSGCLEDGNLLETISDSLDGGKEAVERRLKVYGTN